MRSFSYTIKDALGIHARPAGMLAKTAKSYESEITIEKDGKSVSCKGLLALMGLGVKCGDSSTVRWECGCFWRRICNGVFFCNAFYI